MPLNSDGSMLERWRYHSSCMGCYASLGYVKTCTPRQSLPSCWLRQSGIPGMVVSVRPPTTSLTVERLPHFLHVSGNSFGLSTPVPLPSFQAAFPILPPLNFAAPAKSLGFYLGSECFLGGRGTHLDPALLLLRRCGWRHSEESPFLSHVFSIFLGCDFGQK